MKKRILTYALFISFLSLTTLCGHAAPAKTTTFHSSSKNVIKKTFPVAIENKNGGHGDFYTINNRTRLNFSITSSSIIAENIISLSLFNSSGGMVAISGIERVLKDHLLHLFPSHYFW